MKQVILISISLLALHQVSLAGPEIPGPQQTRPIAIVGGTVHPVSSGAIEKGTVLFENGRITAVGQRVELPPGTRIVKADGQHVYPGLFNTDGVLGLIEINAVRSTDDRGEVGQWNMNVRTEKAINPDSQLIPVTRASGVLFSLTAPTRGTITGTSAVLQLDGWTTEDLTLHASAAMHIRWPSLLEAPHQHDDDDDDEKDRLNRQKEQLQQLENTFEQASVYLRSRQVHPSQPIDLRWEAMIDVLEGKLPIIVVAERAVQIQSAVAFANRWKLRLIIYGGNDAVECAELLRSQNIPVIVNGVYRLPLRRDAAYDAAYTLPDRLRKANVTFCIAGSARFDASNIRNLPYHAAMAVAFGLPREMAIRAITLSPAEILGVADRIGSLEPGKHASLIVADGDILDTATEVTHAYLQGRKVDLSDKQKRLYQKYSERQRQVKAEAK